MTSILTARHVCKRFPSFDLHDVCLDLPQGSIMGLVGPNGAGKTTLIKALMNAVVLQSGDVEIFGQPLMANEAAIKDRIGYVGTDPLFCREWTCRHVGAVMRSLYRSWDQSAFDGYVTTWRLDTRKRVKELSQGQQRQLSVAVALSHKTDLLILDEPTSGLDPSMRAAFVDEFQRYVEGGHKSVLFSTHIISDLERCADLVTFIYDGRIVFSQQWDGVAEDYMIVRGRRDELSQALMSVSCGWRMHDFGFEALLPVGELAMLPPSCEATPADMESILVLFRGVPAAKSREEARK